MNNLGRLPIVVGIDGSDGSELALRWAYREAALLGRSVVAVLGWTADGRPRSVYRAATHADHAGLAQAAAHVLDEMLARVPQLDPAVGVRTVVANEDPAEVLLREAEKASMIVVGVRGAGLGHRVFAGSVSMKVVHHAPVPVVVVRDGHGDRDASVAATAVTTTDVGADDRRAVVVGVDGSPASRSALGWAANEAALRKVPLRAVYAWYLASPPYSTLLETTNPSIEQHAQDVLDAALADQLVDDSDVTVTKVVVAEAAAKVLIRESAGAQLLVVGSRGHGGFAELLLGSVSHQCVTHAACPVAVVRE